MWIAALIHAARLLTSPHQQRTALSRIDELLGPSREEALGSEECKSGTFVSTDWRKLEHLSVLHCEVVAMGYEAMSRLPSLQHLELQVSVPRTHSVHRRHHRREGRARSASV
jgi:hypothetical protein